MKRLKIIIPTILAATLLAVGGYFTVKSIVDTDDVDPNATSIVDPVILSGEMPGKFSVVGIKKIFIEAGKTDVSTYFINPQSNTVYLKATLMLADGTLLFESGLIPPGNAVYVMKMKKPLDCGEYNATVVYTAYDMTDKKQKNSVSYDLVIVAS